MVFSVGASQASVTEPLALVPEPEELLEPLLLLPEATVPPLLELLELLLPEAIVPPLLELLELPLPEATVPPLLELLELPEPLEGVLLGPVALAPVLATGVAVAVPVGAAGVTMIDRGGSGSEVPLALADMTMFEYWPVSALVGVPESSPVTPLKLAQAGLCSMLYEAAEAVVCGRKL